MNNRRRNFLKFGVKSGLAVSCAPLWSALTSMQAFAQSGTGSSYKAVVLIHLQGGNDSNNLLVPLDPASYAEYAAMRTTLALPPGALHVISGGKAGGVFGLHPALVNVANRYNKGQASVIANVGPLAQLATKSQLLDSPHLYPESLLNHPVGVAQWQSSTTIAQPTSGWGGRMADSLVSQSGNLPPILDLSGQALFTVGNSVQGIAVQSASVLQPLPPHISDAILARARQEGVALNHLVAQAAQLRVAASNQQTILSEAMAAGPTLKTIFPTSSFGGEMKAIAQLFNGRSVVGALRQLLYVGQGIYDTHEQQLGGQDYWLRDLDQGIGALMQALDEMGLTDQVLICTHSDFNRSMQANTSSGSDHAWGSHQLVLGGGIAGGQVFGSLPALEFGGSSDMSNIGVWIPTLSVTQLTGAIGSWMGLSSSQLATILPDLANFPQGAINFTTAS